MGGGRHSKTKRLRESERQIEREKNKAFRHPVDATRCERVHKWEFPKIMDPKIVPK